MKNLARGQSTIFRKPIRREITLNARPRSALGDVILFGRALLNYFKIMVGLLRREEEKRRTYPVGAFLALFEPVVIVLILACSFYILERRGNSPLGGHPLLFYVTGLFAKFYFIYASRRMGSAVSRPRRRFPMEQTLDHVFAHILISTVDYVLLGLFGFGVLYCGVTTQALPDSFVPLFASFAALAGLAFFWGILNMIISRKVWFWKYIFAPLNRILIVFSGAFFLVDYLPPWPRHLLSFNPIVHALALFRMGFYPNHPTQVYDGSYLAKCTLVAVLFGLALERVNRRYEHK